MKILFLYLVPPQRFIPRGFSHGIASMSAVLKRAGHTTELLYLESLAKDFLNRRISSDTKLIAVSSTTDQYDLAKQVIGYISRRFDIPIVLGGVHATVAPEEAIQTDGLLGICVGEGEGAILELVRALENHADYAHIRNFWFRSGNTIVKNDVRPLIEDLDTLPFPDRPVFNYQEILDRNYQDGAEFMVGRGCPFQCSFCINKKLQNLYKGKGRFVRYRSVDRVMVEIQAVTRTYTNIRKITFQDDILGLNKQWLEEFSHKYGRDIQIPFRCNLRADCVDDETLQLLKNAGCAELWVGVECGSEKLRNALLNKQLPTQTIIDAFKLIKKYNLASKAFNMIGLPGETKANIEETFQLNKVIVPDIRSVTIFRPYPGTALYDYCKEKNWLSNRKVSGYWEESVLDQPTLSKEDTYFYQLLFYYEMKAPWVAKFMRWLNRIKIMPHFTLFRLLHNKSIMYRLYTLTKKSGRKI